MSHHTNQAIIAYLSIGSNLADPIAQVHKAILALKSLPQSAFISCSRLYRTKPWGPVLQPEFINCVISIQTQLTPLTLLQSIWQIENQQSRVREERYGPRTLDIDILLYGEEMMTTAELIIPHPRLAEREFVLYPLAEIAPALQLPDGRAVAELLAACAPLGICPLEEERCLT